MSETEVESGLVDVVVLDDDLDFRNYIEDLLRDEGKYSVRSFADAKTSDVERFKRLMLVTGSILTGAAVSVAGLIGFVGLMTPHILRLVVGSDHRRLIPASVLGGAAFMVLADLVARVAVRPEEIPVGAVTAVLGGPFFLYLLRRDRKAAGVRG